MRLLLILRALKEEQGVDLESVVVCYRVLVHM